LPRPNADGLVFNFYAPCYAVSLSQKNQKKKKKNSTKPRNLSRLSPPADASTFV